jgi:hypothetical protein
VTTTKEKNEIIIPVSQFENKTRVEDESAEVDLEKSSSTTSTTSTTSTSSTTSETTTSTTLADSTAASTSSSADDISGLKMLSPYLKTEKIVYIFTVYKNLEYYGSRFLISKFSSLSMHPLFIWTP